MRLPLVTVAIPVRNGADYLDQAIDSALAQTYDGLEVLVVNDGSDDGGATEAVALSYGDAIRYVAQDHGGVASALNTALRAMTGEVFTWLSHDDQFEPLKTELQVERHQRAGGRTDVALFSDFRWMDADGAVIGEERADHAALVANPMLAFYDGRINGCTVFAPRDLMIAIGGFDERLHHVQDYAAWRALIRRAALLHMPEFLVRTRLHDRQHSRTPEAGQETEPFWSQTLSEVGEVEAALVHGGREMLLRKTAGFLRYRSPNRRTSEEARRAAGAVVSETLVTVVLDVGGDPEAARGSADSVLAQTHPWIELILVGAEAALVSSSLAELGGNRQCVLLPTSASESVGRWRVAALQADGAYLALLEAGDLFEPDKIKRQVHAMSAAGQVWSHTSYTIPDGSTVNAGAYGGRVYPEILGGCPIHPSTVMLHRALVAGGVVLSEPGVSLDLSWIEAAARHPLMGLEPPLTRVGREQSPDHTELLDRLEADPFHSRHRSDLARLQSRLGGPRFERGVQP